MSQHTSYSELSTRIEKFLDKKYQKFPSVYLLNIKGLDLNTFEFEGEIMSKTRRYLVPRFPRMVSPYRRRSTI